MYLYVLKSIKYPKTYVGITSNVQRRLSEHNSGRTGFSKRYKPWRLLCVEEFPTRVEARAREQYYKSAAGRKAIKRLLSGV